MKFWKGERISKLESNYVFVFGSNPEGRHGLGAAKQAVSFGAKYGKGRGLHGQTYALPTKNLCAGYVENLPDGGVIQYDSAGERSLSVEQIIQNISEFYTCAKDHPHLLFFVAYQAAGRNLNGYTSLEMFNMFTTFPVPENVYFHSSFRQFLK